MAIYDEQSQGFRLVAPCNKTNYMEQVSGHRLECLYVIARIALIERFSNLPTPVREVEYGASRYFRSAFCRGRACPCPYRTPAALERGTFQGTSSNRLNSIYYYYCT